MARCTSARAAALLALILVAGQAAAASDATLFRVFLKDGDALVSYGELARVDGRVIFSLKTGTAADAPLQMVNLDENLVDWTRTERYAYAARATHYLATRADADYAAFANEVARTLSAVAFAKDPAERLKLVKNARSALQTWPSTHYNFRQAEVRQMLGMLDDAIASLKAQEGGSFDLALVAYADAPPVLETVLPPPTLKESIEQVLLAARLSDMPVDRESLLASALQRLDEEADALPADFVKTTRAAARDSLDAELALDRRYQALVDDYTSRAHEAARRADVHDLEWILARIRQRDAAMGNKRPGIVNALVAQVSAELDGARRLRLARDHWEMRLPVYREYEARVKLPLTLMNTLRTPLENIKSLAGVSPGVLDAIQQDVAQIRLLAAGITPPDELASAHALLVSAANLAENAARLRREAVMSSDMTKAWDASSAAAGALMLAARANQGVQDALRRPQVP
jgi:hypothetical protein